MGRVVDAKLDIYVDRDKLLTYIRKGEKVVDVESMADSIHAVFCEQRGLSYRGMNPLQRDIHHRQHIEIAKAILEKID